MPLLSWFDLFLVFWFLGCYVLSYLTGWPGKVATTISFQGRTRDPESLAVAVWVLSPVLFFPFLLILWCRDRQWFRRLGSHLGAIRRPNDERQPEVHSAQPASPDPRQDGRQA